jgi:predicted nucleotidyltransferase
MSSTSSAETPPSLLALLQAGLIAAVAPFQPDLVYLFGSAVTGTAGPGSDVDVGILLSRVDPQERRAKLLAMRRAMSQRLVSGLVMSSIR